jgi:hypothetical protein
VRITARLRAFVVDRDGHVVKRKDSKSEQVKLVEYWTLARADSAGWQVVSIEQRAEGDHQLDSEIVASPWSDSRIADEALTELAAEDGLHAYSPPLQRVGTYEVAGDGALLRHPRPAETPLEAAA